MKMKTNKLLTLTLATGLVAMTAGCGGSKTPAATTGGGNGNGPDTPADTVAYNDWSGDATLVTATTANGFVAGNAASIAITPALTGVQSLNLRSQVAAAEGTVSAETLNGAAVDGVAFASTGATTGLRYFAALHSGTDLGAPVPTSGQTATWENGLFQVVGGDATRTTAVKTFALTVTFGTSDTTRTIRALVGANDNANGHAVAGDTSYYLSGTYDAAGVITGNVLYGNFSAAANDGAARTAAAGLLTTATGTAPTAPQTVGLGVLSGLIGAQGAVGAFHSSGSDGNGETGFAGGFVVSALPNLGGVDSNAVYADWSGSATLVEAITANGFVAGGATDLALAAITGTDSTLNLAAVIGRVEATPAAAGTVAMNAGVAGTSGRALGGAATNGVAFAMTGSAGTLRYFAGLHNTTDLGAPFVTAGNEAEWTGAIQVISGTAASAFDTKVFTLTVNFGTTDTARTISAHVAAAAVDFTGTSYYLSGTYDANGVITGTVSSGVIPATVPGRAAATETGVLSGLIGATGAVGAFHSTGTAGDGLTGYAGGFVATPTTVAAATPLNPTAYAGDVVNYADLGVTVLAAYPTTAINGFLGATTATALTGTPATGVTTVSVDDDDVIGGALFFTNEIVTSTASFFAGIHSDTNLGSPITTTTGSAVWTGRFAAVGATGTYETLEKDISLTVAFGSTGGTIQGSVPDGAAADTAFVASQPTYHINATYTALGVISGTIDYNSEATSAAGIALAVTGVTTGGPITGLIGQSGAVGAFHSTATGATGFAGGFAVAPPGS